MISFLIPIYNRNINTFVNELFKQCEASKIKFEILLYDDFSDPKFRELNQDLGHNFGVSYMEMSKNMGRSKIRNWLGKNARYEHLVFMDCDSIIEEPDFVQKYIDHLNRADIIYGGTSYQKNKPSSDQLLHWNYGRKVEAMTPQKRAKMPFRSFRSNNFMIKRSVFIKNLFDTEIEGYGYEDNTLGESLKAQNCTILHIDNPLLHDGLETNKRFLEKTEEAIKNLVNQYSQGRIKTRLTDKYEAWKENNILSLFRFYTRSFAKNRKEKLLTGNSSILRFQLYKMELFDQFIKRN